MQLKQRDLEGHLRGAPASVYLVTGDDTLLVDEAADAIRTAVMASGVTERERHHVEAGFDWNALFSDSQAMSLFGDRKLVEVHMARAAPGDAGSKTLVALAEGMGEDHLLVVAPRLERAQNRSAWVKALDKAGVHVPIWPIDRRQLPRWLADRVRRLGLRLPDGGVDAVVEATEGNLLAAVQELEKLRLQGVSAAWPLERLQQVLSDSARFEGMAALDAALAGDAARALQALRTQRFEGGNAVALVAMFAGEIRRLGDYQRKAPGGRQFDAAVGRAVHFSRKDAVLAALRRLRPEDQRTAMRELAAADACAKGALPNTGDAWSMLERILLRLATARVPSGAAAARRA